MQSLGQIVRLQIQGRSVKHGERPSRWYSPQPLLAVPRVTLSPGGVSGQGEQGEPLIDVHHCDHPASKFSAALDNSVSIGFTGHYHAMRERFGEHLANGVAAENLLVDAEGTIGESDLADGLLIETQDGQRIALQHIRVAEPCLEFTRYALRYALDTPSDGAVQQALAFLRGGLRGFYASYQGDPVTLHLGDRVLRP